MVTKADWVVERHFQSLRGFAANKRRTVNNGQRLKAQSADRERHADYDATLDAILAAGTPELDDELARWTDE